MDRMTTLSAFPVTLPKWLRAHWPALLLPLLAVGTYGLFRSWPSWLLVVAALAMVVLIPDFTAKLASLGLFAYGAYGIFLAHAMTLWGPTTGWLPEPQRGWVLGESVILADNPEHHWPMSKIVYGVVSISPFDNSGYLLPQGIAFIAAGVCLLAVTGAPGGRAVRQALAQLRGTDGHPKAVPPLLLLPVIFLWEELFNEQLWFTWPLQANVFGRMLAVSIVGAGVATVIKLPRVAATTAVAGIVVLGLGGAWEGVRWLTAQYPTFILFYGAVPLHDSLTQLVAAAQGIVLLVAGGLLAPRLLTWAGDATLAKRAQALTQRVDRLTQTRTDATDTAVAELRRIERDLHDGAQARLVAVGMSLRAAEQLMTASPEAALALVAEARETSSRALADLRDLVRGIYPPVLADRGLADAVRTLAMDTPMTVETDITLSGEPPMPVAAAVYFAIAEILTNAVRHSAADTVQIGIGYAGGILRATVTDDGAGGADMSRGTGLAGVERRLATFDGVLAVNSPPGGPTIVVLEVPCALAG
jgi:signal transduction histidine kinase